MWMKNDIARSLVVYILPYYFETKHICSLQNPFWDTVTHFKYVYPWTNTGIPKYPLYRLGLTIHVQQVNSPNAVTASLNVKKIRPFVVKKFLYAEKWSSYIF